MKTQTPLSRVLVLVTIGWIVGGAFAENAAPRAAATEDKIATTEIDTAKGKLRVHALEHATFVMRWNGKTIFVDPVGGVQRFQGHPGPQLILVTDIHGDHMHPDTIKAVRQNRTTIVAPHAVASKLIEAGIDQTSVVRLANGESTTAQGITIEAIPMYNLTTERMKFHPKGRGNGYVVTLGETRVYVSGDTEDVPEMRQLQKIDVAFVCMNLPYTMTAESAASAVREFQPAVVIPYHYRGRGEGGTQDPAKFKQLVQKGDAAIEVRLLKWYDEL